MTEPLDLEFENWFADYISDSGVAPEHEYCKMAWEAGRRPLIVELRASQARAEAAEKALHYIRAEARERAEICTTGTNAKGALEVAVTGLWNVEEAAAQALGITEPTHAEITAGRAALSPAEEQK